MKLDIGGTLVVDGIYSHVYDVEFVEGENGCTIKFEYDIIHSDKDYDKAELEKRLGDEILKQIEEYLEELDG